jgi:molecular chaperone GrpE
MSDTTNTNPESPAPSAEKSLEVLLAETQAKLEQQREAWVRAIADADNARKRARVDIEAAHKFGAERLAESLLPVMDSLEAALATSQDATPALRDGIEITLKQLQAAFQKANLGEIAPAAGERFDPHKHQAMAAVESPAEPNSIVTVMRKGYRLNDRVLRPALVTVAKALENKDGNPMSGSTTVSN